MSEIFSYKNDNLTIFNPLNKLPSKASERFDSTVGTPLRIFFHLKRGSKECTFPAALCDLSMRNSHFSLDCTIIPPFALLP